MRAGPAWRALRATRSLSLEANMHVLFCLFVFFRDRILINSAHADLIEIIGKVLQVTMAYRLRQ